MPWAGFYMSMSMRAANRRPPRPQAPQLLVLPGRDRIERALRPVLAKDADIIALELERNHTLRAGDVLELVVVVRFPWPDNKKRLTVRHVMPGWEPDMRELLSGAEALGQAVAMRFRGYGGKWGAPVLSDDLAE